MRPSSWAMWRKVPWFMPLRGGRSGCEWLWRDAVDKWGGGRRGEVLTRSARLRRRGRWGPTCLLSIVQLVVLIEATERGVRYRDGYRNV